MPDGLNMPTNTADARPMLGTREPTEKERELVEKYGHMFVDRDPARFTIAPLIEHGPASEPASECDNESCQSIANLADGWSTALVRAEAERDEFAEARDILAARCDELLAERDELRAEHADCDIKRLALHTRIVEVGQKRDELRAALTEAERLRDRNARMRDRWEQQARKNAAAYRKAVGIVDDGLGAALNNHQEQTNG